MKTNRKPYSAPEAHLIALEQIRFLDESGEFSANDPFNDGYGNSFPA